VANKKAAEETGTDVVQYTGTDISEYAPIAIGMDKIAEIIRENLGERGLTVSDLVRIKMPSGGMQAFEIGDDVVKEVTGIIVRLAEGRSYWERAMDDPDGESGAPPDCSSVDRKTGAGPLVESGILNGDCATCPFNRYGTRGRGKACKEFYEIFILPPEELFPMKLRVSPASLKKVDSFMARLSSKMLLKQHLVVTLGLDRASNRDGQDYSVLTLKPAETDGLRIRGIRGDHRPALDSYVTGMQPGLIQQAWQPRDDDAIEG
jgi:hypothetical protein|tara:strand:- start:4431 stop:5216 length:786 start_codon:yes stop_codon:yes gene_type:complete